jgi:hypothetical protein
LHLSRLSYWLDLSFWSYLSYLSVFSHLTVLSYLIKIKLTLISSAFFDDLFWNANQQCAVLGLA